MNPMLHYRYFIAVPLSLSLLLGAGCAIDRAVSDGKGSAASPSPAKVQVYRAPELGLSFEYPNDFVLQSVTTTKPYLANLVLLEKKVWEDMKGLEDTEGPPAIHVDVFENTQKLPLLEWAKKNEASNIRLAKGETHLAGRGDYEALNYETDGLYATRYQLMGYAGKVYLFSADRTGDADRNVQAFDELLVSLRVK